MDGERGSFTFVLRDILITTWSAVPLTLCLILEKRQMLIRKRYGTRQILVARSSLGQELKNSGDKTVDLVYIFC